MGLMLTLMFLSLFSYAQSTVTGNVVEANGEPLIGATVLIVNTSMGTITDIDGNFSLKVSELPVTLEISSTGFKPQRVEVSSESPISVTMDAGLNIDEIVVVGSRGKPRTILESAVPIDNINAADLLKSGQSSVDQMINYRVPSYNSTNQTISDATAHFDPSELRNLGPSRTLVLVNGKRKNQSALVYVNDTPGKGEVGTDMKSIPTSAIERVEVLRDGAAAQYGSDAVAGVVNIVLKNRTDGNVNIGTGITTKGDGLTYDASVNKGFKIGSNGFLNMTASYYHQDYTDRAGEPGGDGLFGVVFGDDDILNGTTPWQQANPDLGMIVGQPEYDKYSIFANFGNKYSDNKGEFYLFGGYTKRDGKSFALYRAPYWITDDFGLLTPSGEPYNGFQPTFETAINDYNFTIGNKYDFNGWGTDISLTAGGNDVDYTIGNTINPSLGANSPTEFNAGAYAFSNILGNIDVSKTFNDQVTLSFGTEARREQFQVTAGQEESYIDGGAQSFPGLQESNEKDTSRVNVGVYLGTDYDVTKEFLISGAVRFENYSDFGSNLSWKISSRYLLGDGQGAIRGSVSTGFRAPSLHQIYLSNVQTLVSGGTISNQGTFSNDSRAVQALGIPKLDAETSLNFTAGITYKLTDGFTLTADYYNVSVDNRVLFTGEVGGDGDPSTTTPVEQILIDNDVTSIKFFVNALDTKTQGFDFVADYSGVNVGEKGSMDFILSMNVNETKIDKIVAPGVLGEQNIDIFNRKEQSRVTTARPNFKTLFGITYKTGGLSATLNNTYFGKVKWQHATDVDKDQEFAGKVITDLILGYDINKKLNFSINVNNLLNVYPDEIVTGGDFVTDLGGRFKYPWEVNQFGFNGTTISGRISYDF